MRHKLHTHPRMERELGVNEQHVIIDYDVYIETVNVLYQLNKHLTPYLYDYYDFENLPIKNKKEVY